MPASLTPPRSRKADAEAAVWLARAALNGPLSAEDQRSFDAWLREPGHAAAHLRLSGAFDLSADAEPVARAVNARARIRARRRRVAVTGASTALVITLVAFTTASVDLPARFADERSAPGQVRRLALEDGSTLWLDADSAVDLDFTQSGRTIDLVRGQIFVQAAHESRPLRVRVAGGEALDIGTAFEVREGAASARVTVTQGAVRVSSAGRAVHLTGGQTTSWRRGSGPLPVQAMDVELAALWREGRIVVDNRPLSEVVAEVNRHARKPYLLTDRHARARRVSGVIQTDAIETGFGSLAGAQGLSAVDLGLFVWLRRDPDSEKKN